MYQSDRMNPIKVNLDTITWIAEILEYCISAFWKTPVKIQIYLFEEQNKS